MNIVIVQNSQTRRWQIAVLAANGHAVARGYEDYGIKRSALRAANALLEQSGKMLAKHSFSVHTERWFWILRGKGGRPLLVSTDTYTRRANAVRSANKLLSAALTLKGA